MRVALLLSLSIPLCAADSALQFSRTIGGTDGASSVADIATDAAGNVYVAGSTFAFDFPVTNGTKNKGAGISSSVDSGKTWQPVSNLPTGAANAIALDASGALYSGGTQGIFRSTDGGKTWQPTAPFNFDDPDCKPSCAFNAIVADPLHAGVIYAAGSLGIFKTVDAGVTWRKTTAGYHGIKGIIAPVNYLVIDPLHPEILHLGIGVFDFLSINGAESWTEYALPKGLNNGGSRVAFDRNISGLAYHGGPGGLYLSQDSGQTWTLSSFLDFAIQVATAPSAAGTAYVLDTGGRVSKTTDSGATWNLISSKRFDANSPLYVDAFDPLHLYSGAFESQDGGANWLLSSLGRSWNQLLFDPRPKGLIYAASNVTPDMFLAKFGPTGRNVLFATYFGGAGEGRPVKLSLDAAGNAYIFGFAPNGGVPITPGAAFPQPYQPPSYTPRFVAKFSPEGELKYATYIEQDAVIMAASPDGSVILTGPSCLVQKLSPDGGSLVWAKQITKGSCNTISVNDAGAIFIGGETSTDFAVTPDAVQATRKGTSDAVLVKLDSDGNITYATYLGGPPTPTFKRDGAGSSRITNISFDAKGNILLAGNTAALFPTTPGAYQSSLQANCPYPSSVIATGFIGTIITYHMDDVFVTKLDPSGHSILFSTLLGGDCFEQAGSLSADADGSVWISGSTNSNPFPEVAPFASGPAYSQYQRFISEFDPTGQSLLLSSYLNPGTGIGLASDHSGGVWVGGTTADGSALIQRIGPAATNPVKITGAGNAFTGRSGPLSPGEFASITLDGFHPEQPVNLGWSTPLPSALSGVQVFFDGEPAALISVDDGFITCITPYSLKGKKTTTIEVLYKGHVSTALIAPVQEFDAGLLSLDGSGQGQANARNDDGRLNTPNNPATGGSTVTFYMTGVGLSGNSCPYGQLAPDGFSPSTQAFTNFGTFGVAPLHGFVCGIFELHVNVPNSQPGVTSYPINVSIRSDTSTSLSQTLTFAVK